MIKKIRKWLFQLHYVHQLEKEGWLHDVDASMASQEMVKMTNYYNDSVKGIEAKEKKIEELVEQSKKPDIQGPAYTHLIDEIKTLTQEIDADVERNKDFQANVLPKKKIEIGRKRNYAWEAYAKADMARKAKI